MAQYAYTHPDATTADVVNTYQHPNTTAALEEARVHAKILGHDLAVFRIAHVGSVTCPQPQRLKSATPFPSAADCLAWAHVIADDLSDPPTIPERYALSILAEDELVHTDRLFHDDHIPPPSPLTKVTRKKRRSPNTPKGTH